MQADRYHYQAKVIQDALAKFNAQCATKCSKFTLFSLLLHSLTDFLNDIEREPLLTSPFAELVSGREEAELSLDGMRQLSKAKVAQLRKLGQMKELALVLPLSPAFVAQVSRLEEQWAANSASMTSRMERLQDYCLRSMQLQEKYLLWCDWLESVKPLVEPIQPSSEDSLSSLLSRHQMFELEAGSKAKILNSIVSEGETLASIESPRIKIKPAELQSQWEELQLSVANNRMATMETMQRWETFNKLRERLSHALTTLDGELQLVAHKKEAHLSMYEKIPALKTAFEQHQQVALLMRQVGQRLLPDCEEKSRLKILAVTRSLHGQWQSVLSKLISQSEESSSLIATWRQMEGVFSAFNQDLKSIRLELLKDVADHHDILQDQRAQCDILEQKLDNIASRMALVKFDFAKLEGHLDDISSLNNRVHIYSSLVEETKAQVVRRKSLIGDRLSLWSSFLSRVDRLLAEIGKLEKSFLNESQFTIEELLDHISTQYEPEMIRMESRVELIVAEGERLLPLSGDIYSSTIRHNCLSLSTAMAGLEKLADTRTMKLRETLTAILEFENGMQALNAWLVKTEKKLSQTELSDWRSETIAEEHSALTLLENNIDHHGRVVTAVVNLCSVLQHDLDATPSQRDRTAISTVRQSLKLRWKTLCNKVRWSR